MKMGTMSGEKMKEMNRIKIRKRCMPETNSSSSHSVSISMGSNFVKPGDKEWDVTIEDGVLKIPGGVSFGWEFFRSNSVLTKLQYLCGIYCDDITGNGQKRISKLRRILKSIFGVKKVEFLWIAEYFKELHETGKDPEDVYYGYPEIDHNSHDIFEDITESVETIRHFLLCRDSWLFGGNDNSEEPEGFFYNLPIRDNDPRAILSIELGGEFGRVDWEVKDFPIKSHQIIQALTTDDDFGILSGISYNTETKKIEFTVLPEKVDYAKYLETTLSINMALPLYKDSGKFYVIFCNHRFYDIYRELVKPGERGNTKQIKETLEKLEEEKDYILLPVSIRLLDYGDYNV